MASKNKIELLITADGKQARIELDKVRDDLEAFGRSADGGNARLQDLTNTLFSFSLAQQFGADLKDLARSVIDAADQYRNLAQRIALL